MTAIPLSMRQVYKNARGIPDEEVMEGSRRGTLAELTDRVIEADKTLVFWLDNFEERGHEESKSCF